MRFAIVAIVTTIAVVVASSSGCGGRVVTDRVACGEPIESYCAAAPGGCPTENTWDAFCAWGARRGTPSLYGGGPIVCDSGLSGFEVDEGDVVTVFLFRGDQLAMVSRSSPRDEPRSCVAGASEMAKDSCSNEDVAFVCGPSRDEDAGGGSSDSAR